MSQQPFQLAQRLIAKFNLWQDRIRPPLTVRPIGAKRALLSYIVYPFRPNPPKNHCNVIECVQMADVLNELGYCVDVVDYRNTTSITYQRYDLILGFGLPFARAFGSGATKVSRINYLTGANPNFSNVAEAQRIAALHARKGREIKPRREVYHPWINAAVNSDGLIVTGNGWTASTYADINPFVETVPVPYATTPSLVSKQERGFVWFGGTGAAHKGLDLVLDAMSEGDSSFHLDVCGPTDRDRDFFELYAHELTGNPRIKYWGMIDPTGPIMHEIVARNTFVILPSCSEGGASSVITCMAHGMIPIVTRESSIDLYGFGVEIASATVAGVRAAMQTAWQLPTSEVSLQRHNILAHVLRQHSPQVFKASFSKAVQSILGQTS